MVSADAVVVVSALVVVVGTVVVGALVVVVRIVVVSTLVVVGAGAFFFGAAVVVVVVTQSGGSVIVPILGSKYKRLTQKISNFTVIIILVIFVLEELIKTRPCISNFARLCYEVENHQLYYVNL